jgi:putative phage-type endonuclease
MECIKNDKNDNKSDNMEEKKKLYLYKMEITQEDIIKVMNIPQRTPEWINWRSCRMTASNYGTAAGHNPYRTPRQLLSDLLWNTFKGNNATEWGTKYEPVAAQVYENFISKYMTKEGKMSFFYPGLIISKQQPWLAVSPDGLPSILTSSSPSLPSLSLRFLLEIKCPASLKLYPHIPHYYFDQIQGIMGILNLPFCDFVVWTPQKTQIRRYNFDETYWKNILFPRLHNFYMNEYLPRLILKEEGKLKEGELEETIHIDIPISTSAPKDFDFIWPSSSSSSSPQTPQTQQTQQTQQTPKKQKIQTPAQSLPQLQPDFVWTLQSSPSPSQPIQPSTQPIQSPSQSLPQPQPDFVWSLKSKEETETIKPTLKRKNV